jgi:hypothetical protein
MTLRCVLVTTVAVEKQSVLHILIEIRECMLSHGAEFVVFQFAIQCMLSHGAEFVVFQFAIQKLKD